MTLKDILKAVSKASGFSAKQLKGRSRKADISMARNAYYHLGVKYGFGLTHTAGYIGRVHSTIINVGAFDKDVLNKALKKLPKLDETPCVPKINHIYDISSRYFGECYLMDNNGNYTQTDSREQKHE